MPKFQDLSGQRFGRWTVIRRTEDYVTTAGYHFTQYECRCDCGNIRNVIANSLKNGRSGSCGCLGKEVASKTYKGNFSKHGDTNTRLYQIYAGMKKRCCNKKSYNYANYGGRGISICDEWLKDWSCFKEWAFANGYNDNLTIDRIDVDGDYDPNNCRWVDCVAQANNRRTNRYITYNNETHTMAEWGRILEIPYHTIYKKIKMGKSLEEIMA